MKKLISVLLAMVLCLSAIAAIAAPFSPGMSSLAKVEFETAEPADAAFFIKVIDYDELDEDDQELVAAEIEKLNEAKDVVEYFGEIKDADGNVIDLKEFLGAEEEDELTVNEFAKIVAENYDEKYGDVTVTLTFATPYDAEKEPKVCVLIGVVTTYIDGTQNVEWKPFDGEVQEDGSVKIVMKPEDVKAIEGETALIAVVSKVVEEEEK